MTTQVRAVLVVSCDDQAGPEPAALLPLTDKCSLDYWLDSFKGSLRLQPLSDKVLVVCSARHHQRVLSWATARGLASSYIIPDTSGAGYLHLAQGIAAAVEASPSLASSYLLAADASYVLEPGTSLAHLVETAVVQHKDVVTSIVPFEGADMSNFVLLHKEHPAAAYSRVQSIDTTAAGAADGCWDTIMGPACVLSPATVPNISAAAAAPGQGLNTIKQLGSCLQQQLTQGTAIYSKDLPFFFSAGTQEDYAVTAAFFAHYTKLQNMAAREVQQLALRLNNPSSFECTGSGTLDELVSMLKSLGGQQPTSPTQRQLLTMLTANKSFTPSTSGSGGRTPAQALSLSGTDTRTGVSGRAESSLKRIFVDFYNQYQEAGTNLIKDRTQRDYSTLPLRFAKSEAWNMQPKHQHPCYSTSNNEYGAKHPTRFDMPLLWAGIQGKFTSTFHGDCYRQLGLKTSVERSRVHRALDCL